MTALPAQSKHVDKHHFYNSEGTVLRLQAFLAIRNRDRRIACLRIDGYDGYVLPGETIQCNENPLEAAARVAKMWFESPLSPRLADIQNYPDDGDKRWYVLFIFDVEEPPGGLKGTPDTREIAWAPAGKPPGPFAMDHEAVFRRLKG